MQLTLKTSEVEEISFACLFFFNIVSVLNTRTVLRPFSNLGNYKSMCAAKQTPCAKLAVLMGKGITAHNIWCQQLADALYNLKCITCQ